ncbi:peptidase inhibitor family I36 protein [Kribbella sp. NPDC054772]
MIKLTLLATAATASLLAGGAAHTTAAPPRTETADTAAATVAAAELNCRQTAAKYAKSGYVFLYARDDCAGSNDAKDKGNDSDYGDGKGAIKAFDNKTASVLNTSSRPVKFYTYPKYNSGGKGDSFCLAPGRWVNVLWHYGDTSGNWAKSISSHRMVTAAECSRWFGWQ